MSRLHKVLVVISFTAAIAAPEMARAQTSDRAATQLFYAPTGRVLPKGQAYVKYISLSVPYVQGGLTDRFSIGLGVPLFAVGRGVLNSPKLQIQRSAIHSTSIGAVHFVDTRGAYGVVYVAHTIEREGGALHVTLIKPTIAWSDPRAFAVMLGAERQLNSRVTFMTENYLFAGGHPIISGGIRLKAAHTTWDVGLLVPPTSRYTLRPSPMVNGGWKF